MRGRIFERVRTKKKMSSSFLTQREGGGEKMKKGAWRGIRNEIVENIQRSVLGKVLGGTKEVDEMENLTWRGIRRERVKNHA